MARCRATARSARAVVCSGEIIGAMIGTCSLPVHPAFRPVRSDDPYDVVGLSEQVPPLAHPRNVGQRGA